MKIEGYLFVFIAVFMVVVGCVYLPWSGDVTGGVALFFGGGMAIIVSTYLLYHARRIGPRPEDRDDADVEEGSGEIGFFSPHSWWPIFMAFSAGTMFIGVMYGKWFILGGAVLVGIAVAGFVLEYYVKEEP